VVRRFKRNADKSWTVTLADAENAGFLQQGQRCTAGANKDKFGFNNPLLTTVVGIRGGAALTLLQETGIPQAKEYAGFPVGGQFLVCENPERVYRR
jgi:malate dehydrogenase (quinone)